MIIGICDDEPQVFEEIKNYIAEMPFLQATSIEYHTFSPEELAILCASVDSMPHFDLMIMDIYYEDIDYTGIELTKKINTLLPNCQIIYFTQVLDFAPYVYETNHCYFVMKNQKKEMLESALRKALHNYESVCRTAPLCISSNANEIYLNKDEILYIEKIQRQTIIHTLNSDFPCYLSLSELLRNLNEEFVRCHGSFIINLSYVSDYASDSVTLQQTRIPLGKTYRRHFRNAYTNYHQLSSELVLCNELNNELAREQHTITQLQFKPSNFSYASFPIYTNHSLINSILQYELSKYEEHFISFNFDCKACTERNWRLDETDTIHLLCNLLDNAFESAKQTDTPFVQIQFSYCAKTKRYTILQRNSKVSSSHPILSNFATSKKEETSTSSHGHGVSIIRKIVAKYEGCLEFNDYDTFFQINITI